MQVINQIGCLFADRSVEKSGIFDESLSLSLSLSIVSIRRGNFQRRGMYVSRYLINGTFDIFARFNRATRVNESG